MMRKLSVAAAIAFLAQPLYAADDVNTVTMSATGEGGWEIICHATAADGDQPHILYSSRPSFSGTGIHRLACTMKNASKGPLVVHVTAPNSACPFRGAAEGVCEQTLRKGGADSFDLKINAAR